MFGWLASGCPELAASQRNATIDAYRTNGLSPNDVAEAVYRIAIDPKPRLRYLVMRDDNWKTYIPVFCRCGPQSAMFVPFTSCQANSLALLS